MTRLCILAALLWAATGTAVVRAGGLDLPTVYGARYGATGGASSAHVDDASAILHNPAGLAHLPGGLTATNSLSLFLVNLQTSPDFTNQNLSTGVKVGPTLLGSAGFRVHDRVVVGIGMYPVGAAGGEFSYRSMRGTEQVDWVNEQMALAFEVSPGVGVELTDGLRVGLGYRVTALLFERVMGAEADPVDVNIDLFGMNFAGLRLGAQWQPIDALELGVTYRHKVTVDASADSGTLLGADLVNIDSSMVVPSKLTLGALVHVGKWQLLGELDYIANSQFDSIPISGDLPDQDGDVDVEFRFDWTDSYTAKLGLAYEVLPGWTLRQGYALDSTPSNPAFPTTFGSPPADSHWLTLGGGYQAAHWRLDVALMHKLPTSHDLREGRIEADCRFCASGGRYRSEMSAIMIDFTHHLGFGEGTLRR